jgi:pimeloyl-ACP methyl ester carboxylesterase
MTSFHGSWLDRPWGPMRLWRGGRGPVVLAVHGLGGSGRYWKGLVDRIGARYTIVAPDLPGFGASRASGDDIVRVSLLADLDAVVASTAPDAPLLIVGHSLGGVLAALWTCENRERVSAMALAAPPYPDGSAMDVRSRADLRPSAGRRAAARLARAIWPVIALPIGLVRGYPPAVVVDFGRQSVRARAWTMWSLWSDPALAGEVEALSTLDGSIPTMLAQARDDRTVSLRAHGEWAHVLPHAERHIVEAGGHQFLLRTGFDPLASWLLRPPGERLTGG